MVSRPSAATPLHTERHPTAVEDQPSMTRIIRPAFILTFTAIAMLMVGPDLMLPWHPYSTFGLRADRYGTIVRVDPRVAETTGLRLGDRVELKRLPPLERARYMGVVPEGLVLRLP